MQRGAFVLALALCLFLYLFTIPWLAAVSPSSAETTTTGQTTREAALFVRNAFDASSPFSYWSGDETDAPTIYFYMEHQPWHSGSDVMRREGTKILSCVAGLLSASLNDATKPISTSPDLSHRYRILINPRPPGGGTQLAAEGTAQRDGCPEGREQDLILKLLMSESNPHTF